MKNALKLLAVAAALLASGRQGGKYSGANTFQKSCKACHVSVVPPRITPSSRPRPSGRLLRVGTHKNGARRSSPPEARAGQDVQTFLVNHASDSPNPKPTAAELLPSLL